MTLTGEGPQARLDLRGGDHVRLRGVPELLEVLDGDGCTDALPFMEELLQFSGKTLEVESRADKTCDTINMSGTTRAMTDTVHLAGLRCDGSAHGGCQAYCLFYVKEQWLERADRDSTRDVDNSDHDELTSRLRHFADAGPNTYRCQATQALEASRPLTGAGHYLRDLQTRNVPIRRLVAGLFWVAVNRYQDFTRWHFPRRLRYRDGHHLPDVRGTVRDENWPPPGDVDLSPGDLVEVRSRDEIRATLDEDQRNKGLWFDEEMARLCGRRGRILYRVERLIDEKTGRMLKVKKDLFVVSGLVGCEGIYHKLCTRSVIAMMRAAWLRRVD